MKELVSNFLELLVLLSIVFLVLIIFLLIIQKINNIRFSWFYNTIRRNYFAFGFIVSLTATLGSLFYSEVMNFTPCGLCWWQRIFMYPQAILFGLALWRKDKRVARYSIVLSFIGLVISAYHYIMQIGLLEGTCDAIGYSSSCSDAFFLAYGFITIPLMAFTAFLLLIILNWVFLKN